MKHVIKARLPAETHTMERRWANTETPEQAVGMKQPPQGRLSERNLQASQVGILMFVSGDKEHGAAPSRVGAFWASSIQDQTDAVLNTAEEDLLRYMLRHMRRTRWSIAQCAPSLHFTRVDRQYIRFRGKLIATLLDEPIEDGVTHPAEGLIDEALRTNPSDYRDWLSQALVEHFPTRPSISASIVRCIGRLESDQVGPWGMHVADDALRHKDVEVREAGVRSLEAWGGREALEILHRHRDSEAWLDEYVKQVIVDLSGAMS